MLWKAQIKGGHCPEEFIIKTTKPTVVLCEYPAQNMLQAALCCWRRTWGSGITCLEIKVEVQGLTSLRYLHTAVSLGT